MIELRNNISIANVEYGGGIRRFINELKKQLEAENYSCSVQIRYFKKNIRYFLFFNIKYDQSFWIFPGIFIPLFIPKRSVIVIHDMIQVDYQQYYSWIIKLYFQFFLRRNVKKCKFVITVSNFSKKRIVEYFNIPGNKVLVLRNGVSNDFIQSGSLDFCERENMLICVTNGKDHKNDVAAIEIFRASKLHGKFKLVFVGEPSPEVLPLITDFDLARDVDIKSSVTEVELIKLYKQSKLLLFPSLYEGFGLPVIEAMSVGTPVMMGRHNIGVAEYIDGAFVEIDLNDLTRSGYLLASFLNNQEKWRSVQEKGLEAAKMMSWNNSYYIRKILDMDR